MNHFALNAMTSRAKWNTHFECFSRGTHTPHTHTQPLTSPSKSKLKNVSLYVLKLHRWYLCRGDGVVLASVQSDLVFFSFRINININIAFDLCSQLVSWIWFNLLSIFSLLCVCVTTDQHLAMYTNLFLYFLGTDFILIMIVYVYVYG